MIRTLNGIVDGEKSIEYKLRWLRTFTEYKVWNEVTDWSHYSPSNVYVRVCCVQQKTSNMKWRREKKVVDKHTEYSSVTVRDHASLAATQFGPAFLILVSKSNEISFENPFSWNGPRQCGKRRKEKTRLPLLPPSCLTLTFHPYHCEYICGHLDAIVPIRCVCSRA